MRISTDIEGLERVAGPGMEVVVISEARIAPRWKRNLRLLFSAFRSEHLVLHFHLTDVMFFAFFLTLVPFHRCKISTLDFFAGDMPSWLRPLARMSLSRVARFLVYFRDSSAFQQLFRIPPSKFYYIPFKINKLELIAAAGNKDLGYIFSGGRSRRDFATFFSAVESLGYPVKLITGEESDLTPHGSSLRQLKIPGNVEIFRDDSNARHFVELLAGARLVVIPLVKNTRTQAGIGVYLQAMAARKCLIISSGLGVSDVLTGEEAMIVPAGDADALRSAIKSAWEDSTLRERYAMAAAAYALPLGGEDQLRRSILASLP